MVRSTLGAVNPKFSYSSCRSEVLHLASTDITSFQESQTEFLASNLDTPFKLSEPQFTHLQSGLIKSPKHNSQDQRIQGDDKNENTLISLKYWKQ